MATAMLFDFNDGNGPVPAHRHSNGGGWVADTAYVEDTIYLGWSSLVYGPVRFFGTGGLKAVMTTITTTPMLFDFKDGNNGPVSAHRHPNGGGWVADTAYVDKTIYIGPYSRVYGPVRIYGRGVVYCGSEISKPGDILIGRARGRSGTYSYTICRGSGFVWGCRNGPSVKAWIESQGDYDPETTDAAMLISLEDELNKGSV